MGLQPGYQPGLQSSQDMTRTERSSSKISWVALAVVIQVSKAVRLRNLVLHHPGLSIGLLLLFSCSFWLFATMDCSIPGFPVLHHLLKFAQTHVRCVRDAIQLSHLLSSPSPPILSLSQYQGLFQLFNSSHQVAKVFELQHQSFQWIFRVGFL